MRKVKTSKFPNSKPIPFDVNQRKGIKLITEPGGLIDCRALSMRLTSPVVSETEPEWSIHFHARERKGRPFVSVTQNASIKDLSAALAIWLIPTCRKLGVDPVFFTRRLADALENIVKSGAIERV